jgi:16S rRNA pseudouridine516 synthase
MLAAVGNHVDILHRLSIGNYVLPENLLEGQWRWLDDKNITDLYQR